MESVESGRCHCFWMKQNSEPYVHLVRACKHYDVVNVQGYAFYPDPSFAIGVLCMLWAFQCEILSDRCCKD